MSEAAVLLMAYGTPRSPEEIEPYYTDIRRGNPPPPELLAGLVRRYDAIGGISPLAQRTEAQRDALARALDAVRPSAPDARLIVVFGATGQRDQGKRPAMGAVAARLADTVIITDDDPHDEDAAAIRADVLAGAHQAQTGESLSCEILEVFPRDESIRRAVELARPQDSILVAGRGHEVWQEVKGVNLALDDRVELRAALTARGFNVLQHDRIES